MLIQLVVSVLGGSLLIGGIAMFLWKKDYAPWKAFPMVYTFLPAIISVLLDRNITADSLCSLPV